MSPEQLAHPPGAAAQRRLDLLARGPRTQALECIRHGDAARIQECECRRQLRREQTKVRLRATSVSRRAKFRESSRRPSASAASVCAINPERLRSLVGLVANT